VIIMTMLMERGLIQDFEKLFDSFTVSLFGAIPTIEYHVGYEGPPPLKIQIDQDNQIVTNQRISMDDRVSFAEDFAKNRLFLFLKETRKPFLIEIAICSDDIKCKVVLGSNLDSMIFKKTIKKVIKKKNVNK